MAKKFYNCFSMNQMKYLLTHGQKPIHEKIHDGTGRTFWVFDKTNQLDALLKMWSNKGKINKLVAM